MQWLKDGRLLGVTGINLLIPNVTSANAGTYSAKLTFSTGKSVVSQSLVLGVGQTPRLGNLSAWRSLPDGLGEGLIAGFVVTNGDAPKKMIVRAVGPSLAQFGFGHVLRQPVLRIRDSKGKLYEEGYVYPAVVGGPTYESDLAESLAKVGAFPTLPGAADVVRLMPFAPGGYTVEITSADNTGGVVLLEVYEVP